MDNNYTKNRLKEIASVALKYGLKNEIRDPKALRLALEELGPSFIKIGQILSTRPDILPMEYIEEFQKLQDDVSPENFSIMREIIEEELRANIDEIFLDFHEKPIASASLSEVYLAKLKSGERVVVKVQRPFVKEKMLYDIQLLKKLSPFIHFTTKEIVDIKKVIDELSKAAEKELDFFQEMDNIIRFAENNKNVKFIRVPKVYREYCTSKLLVMDYISGTKIHDIEGLKRMGYDLEDIASKIIYNYFKQVFEDGFFHADPHPGNILISNGAISYVDFGLMGNLDLSLRKKLNEFLEGVATKDVHLMAKSILKIGIKKGPIDLDDLYRDINILYNSYIDMAIHDYDLSQILYEILTLCKKNNIAMPHNIVLLAKAVMTLQAVIAKMDDNLTLMEGALPYFKDRIIKEKIGNLDFVEIMTFLYSSLKSTLQLSSKLVDFINAGLEGRLKLTFELKDIEENINELNRMVNRLIFGIMITGLLVSSSLVINANVGLKIHGISSIGIVGYLGAGLAGLLLLISIVRSGKL